MVRDTVTSITTGNIRQNDQPAVRETDSADTGDQPSLSETVVGLTTDTESCQDDWLVVSQADTVNHRTACIDSSARLESAEHVGSESHVSLMGNLVAASESSLLNSNTLSPQTLCADVNDSQ